MGGADGVILTIDDPTRTFDFVTLVALVEAAGQHGWQCRESRDAS